MSSPSSRMRPADGRSTPVSRLITVVLPAPFGPIRAWRAPCSILSETPATAAMPPTCFSRPTVSSVMGMSASLLLHPFPTLLRQRRRVAGGGTGRDAARDPLRERAHPAGPDADALAADQHD